MSLTENRTSITTYSIHSKQQAIRVPCGNAERQNRTRMRTKIAALWTAGIFLATSLNLSLANPVGGVVVDDPSKATISANRATLTAVARSPGPRKYDVARHPTGSGTVLPAVAAST